MLKRTRSKGVHRWVRISILTVFVGLMIMVILVFRKYQDVFATNVALDEPYTHFYIYPDEHYDEVKSRLEQSDILADPASFHWVAKKKDYPGSVKPGRYRIENGMSNNQLVNMFRSGTQDPVMVVFHNVRNLAELSGKVSLYLEPDSLEFLEYLTRRELPGEYGFKPETFTCMFIPNTYEFYWTASPEDFTDRMASEYEKFWDKRDRKRSNLDMTREEVITLASIVDEETLHDEENEAIAGVYMNRLEQGIPLQADPTLKFAMNDFTRKRILNADKAIDSPYNTYKNRGLPPGPISIPSVSAIDGVLNYEKHNYIFFCAKPDFSGYHAFARTLRQHNRNARAYQQALNRNRIYE